VLKLFKVSFKILLSVSLFVTAGCASICNMSDTGQGLFLPYGGVRGTLTDWKGCPRKPWDGVEDNNYVLLIKLYYRTIDLPLSFAMDTLFLRFTLGNSRKDVLPFSKDYPSKTELNRNPPLKDFLITQ
jgi:uncharacterized protein YceK